MGGRGNANLHCVVTCIWCFAVVLVFKLLPLPLLARPENLLLAANC